MPPLSETLRHDSPKGFVAADNPSQPSAPASMPGSAVKGNPFIRCPLPPFNANSDTLRQFDESGKIPTRRVIPLPVNTAVGGGSTTNNTTVIQQGSGSSSGGSTTLTAASVTFNVPALGPGATYTATVAMAKCSQLIALVSSTPVEVRIYADPVTQSGDLPRATDSPVPFETVAGIITDVVFDTVPYQWNWQNRICANAQAPQTSNIFVTVVNPSSAGISGATVTITYLALET